MINRQLVIAEGDDQQHPGTFVPPAQKHQQIQRRLIRPVHILDTATTVRQPALTPGAQCGNPTPPHLAGR
jgi:hypothetical protein